MSEYPASIVHAFLDACDRAPDKTCIHFEGRQITYGQLRDQAMQWAGGLHAWGLQPEDRVALYLDNSPTFLAAYLGTYLAGGIVVLVNTQYRQVELRHILNDSGTRVCITDDERLVELNKVHADLPALEAVVLADGDGRKSNDAASSALPSAFSILHSSSFIPPPSPFILPTPSSIALLAYTSGTTGRSKGAMLTHGNLAANARAVTTAWRWSAGDRLLLALPLFHVHGLCVGMHGSFLMGSTVDLRRRFDAAEVFDTLLRGTTAMFFGVPTMYSRLIAEAKQRGRAPMPIRLYVSGSAPLSTHTFDEFERVFGQRILERYGMTETLMNLTNPYDGERRAGTVGQPFPGQEARIVDVQTRQPIRDERPGEIQVRGPHVFKGYWQNPEATASAFDAEGWFNTGDLGWRSADGYFTISGRAHELIISGGYNVYPREVEEVLQAHPGVAEAAVIGLPDADLGEQVVAVVVKRSDAHGPSAEDLVAHCRDRIAAYKKPRRVIFVESLPRNALGKVQKQVIAEWIRTPEVAASNRDLRSRPPASRDQSGS
ncbi:MAG TPA: acyl-CoA synthetase [Anaerolineae bacterium]